MCHCRFESIWLCLVCGIRACCLACLLLLFSISFGLWCWFFELHVHSSTHSPNFDANTPCVPSSFVYMKTIFFARLFACSFAHYMMAICSHCAKRKTKLSSSKKANRAREEKKNEWEKRVKVSSLWNKNQVVKSIENKLAHSLALSGCVWVSVFIRWQRWWCCCYLSKVFSYILVVKMQLEYVVFSLLICMCKMFCRKDIFKRCTLYAFWSDFFSFSLDFSFSHSLVSTDTTVDTFTTRQNGKENQKTKTYINSSNSFSNKINITMNKAIARYSKRLRSSCALRELRFTNNIIMKFPFFRAPMSQHSTNAKKNFISVHAFSPFSFLVLALTWLAIWFVSSFSSVLSFSILCFTHSLISVVTRDFYW